VLAVDRFLDPRVGATFGVSGSEFRGAAGSPVTVRLTASDGLPLQQCGDPSMVLAGTVTSPTTLAATLPPFVLTRDVAAFVAVDFGGGVTAASATPIARLLGQANDAVDHDLDGIRDECDPKTYVFTSSALGVRPADTTPLDGPGQPALVVVPTSFGPGVAFTGSGAIAYERFDRADADFAWQDTTVFLDVDTSGGAIALELGNDGSRQGGAGGSLVFEIRADHMTVFHERRWHDLTRTVIGPPLPESGRVRLRYRKGSGTTSVLHLDARVGAGWHEDLFVFEVADDRFCRGLEVAASSVQGGTRAIRRLTVVREIPTQPFVLAQSPARAMDHQVFQRGGDDTARIGLRLLYRLPNGGTAMPWVVRTATGEPLPGFAMGERLVPLPARRAGRFDLELQGVPVGGNYDVQVGVLDDAGALLGVQSLHGVAVGDVYVAGGQSNMSGASGTLVGAESPQPLAHLFHNDGTWKPAVEPMDDGTLQTDFVSYDDSPRASCLLAFANELSSRTGVPVGVVPAPRAGANLYVQWDRFAPFPAHRFTLYGSMIVRARTACPGTAPRGLLWFQGETDALDGRTTAQYLADLRDFLMQVRGDLAAPELVFLCGQLGTYDLADQPEWIGVQEAQRQAAATDPLTALAPAVDLSKADTIHFDVAGYRTMGRRFATGARRLVFGEPVDPTNDLLTATVVTGGAGVELRYERPVSGGRAGLYRATDATGTVAILDAAVTGDRVTLTFDRSLGAGARLAYGYSSLFADTWLVDAVDGTPVPLFDGLVLTP